MNKPQRFELSPFYCVVKFNGKWERYEIQKSGLEIFLGYADYESGQYLDWFTKAA
jgi:hypothetical protein